MNKKQIRIVNGAVLVEPTPPVKNVLSLVKTVAGNLTGTKDGVTFTQNILDALKEIPKNEYDKYFITLHFYAENLLLKDIHTEEHENDQQGKITTFLKIDSRLALDVIDGIDELQQATQFKEKDPLDFNFSISYYSLGVALRLILTLEPETSNKIYWTVEGAKSINESVTEIYYPISDVNIVRFSGTNKIILNIYKVV